MASITFITKSGEEHVLEADSGTLMELAVKHNVKGIDADCGGVCSCATCHVHVDSVFMEKLEPASETEQDLLEFDDSVTEHSRLSCQINITPELDGLVVRVAND